MERTTEFVKVWFWPRYGSPEPPLDVRFNLGGVDTTLWGKPASFFPSSDTCDLESKLAAHNIIINLTLCKSFCCRCLVLSHLNMFLIGGDFAGNPAVFSGDGCPGDCVSEYCLLTF